MFSIGYFIVIIKHNYFQHDAKRIHAIVFQEPQKHILAEPDCITELERLSASDNAEIRRVAKGALWVLQDKADSECD